MYLSCPAGSSVFGNAVVLVLYFLLWKILTRNFKAFVEPLTCTAQLSKWNVPPDSSTNLAPIDKTPVKNIKFGDNPSTEVEPKNNCYDPRAPSDKYLDNNSMNTLKRLPEVSTFQWIFLFHDIESKFSKNSEKEEIEWEVVEFDLAYETNDVIDFIDEFYDISQDSLKDMADKCVVNISLTDEEIKNIEYSTRGQQSSNFWWEYRKEKLTASNFYIAAVNKVQLSRKIKSLFYSSAKTSSVKHGIVNEIVITVCNFINNSLSYSKFGSTRTYFIKLASFSWGIT